MSWTEEIRLAVIVGSTRPGRRGAAVARWVMETARTHPAVEAGRARVDLVDLADFGLPLLDEPLPARFGEYRHAHTQAWAETIAAYDGFVFVTPEYNHSMPAALKNALDYLYAEWADKAAGFVGYGNQGGARAVEHLRLTLAELKVAGVADQVALSVYDDFAIVDPREPGEFTPRPHQREALTEMLDGLIHWSRALASLRTPA
ncbi:NADPH-dependent FMN reductase [Kribbella deserti]|uniref:NADPH-dependent FMN reductase n=1 Tax=Kribbella deserti TaxID=1926257 RepID=A0ABV6QL12_9ACTN